MIRIRYIMELSRMTEGPKYRAFGYNCSDDDRRYRGPITVPPVTSMRSPSYAGRTLAGVMRSVSA